MYQKVSVLIIEDEKSIRDFISKTLSSSEYKVATAANGKDGMALITSSLPDLVLLDLGLPDMDGLEIIKKTREWSFWNCVRMWSIMKMICSSKALISVFKRAL